MLRCSPAQAVFQFIRILLKAVPDSIGNEICQLLIAGKQPSSEGDAVGLVVEFLRVNLVEMMQLGFL